MNLDIFQPFQLRGRFVYPDLSEHTFTQDEKKTFLELLETEQVDGKPISMNALCARFNLLRSTVRYWKERTDRGMFLHDTSGRPSAIDQKGLEDIHDEVKRRRIAKNPPDQATMESIITSAVHATGERRNVVYDDPSSTTKNKIRKEVGATLRTPQVITKARFEACSDPRMSYTVWIMIDALAKSMPPELFWNWDATQFVVGQNNKNKKVYSVKLNTVEADRSPLSIVGDESLDIGIKWMFMGSATGAAAPIVLLVAVDSLGVEDFEVYAIPGLTCTVNSAEVGYLCVCNSRVGNGPFFAWFIQNIAIVIVERCRTLHEMIPGPNGELPMALITSDGEQIVVDAALTKDVRDALRQHNIHLGKYSASCSGVHQPADVSPLFQASKTKLRSLLSKGKVHVSVTVERHIMKALSQLEIKFNIVVPPGQKNKVVFGCQAVVAAIQKTILPDFIQRGFAECGQFPPDLKKIMKQSYSEITPAQLKAMADSTAEDEAFFLEHGYLTEEQMDRSGLPVVDATRGVPRDQGPLHHHRSVLLTHNDTVSRQQNYVNNGLPLGNAITDANVPKLQMKELKAAAKLLGNAEKRQKRSEEAKQRKASMTPEEKAEDKRVRAVANEARKQKRKADLESAAKLLSEASGKQL